MSKEEEQIIDCCKLCSQVCHPNNLCAHGVGAGRCCVCQKCYDEMEEEEEQEEEEQEEIPWCYANNKKAICTCITPCYPPSEDDEAEEEEYDEKEEE